MTTNVSISPDAYFSPENVVGIYTLYQTQPVHTTLGTVVEADPVEDEEEAKAAKAAVEAKVVKSPGKADAKVTDAGVETK